MSEDKQHIGIVICGHVDAGKSTTTGHLLFELGGLGERELEKLREEARINNKVGFEFAYFMDRQKDERERGVTIACTTKEFFTDNYHYTIIDAPGHRDFIKNMISGASQADVALLLVPAAGYEETIAKPDRKAGVIEGQTRQHARILNLLGVEQLIVGVNKMDAKGVDYSEVRFNEIRDNTRHMLEKIGWKKKIPEIPIIPMSGWRGSNLTKPGTDVMPWWKGFEITKGKKKITGITLVDALTNVVSLPKRDTEGSFHMPVSGCYGIKGVGDVITGRIEQGTLKPGDEVKFAPGGQIGKIFTIEMHHKNQPEARPGDNVGINVKNLPKEKNAKPRPGDVMFIKSQGAPVSTTKFQAMVTVQEHPGKLRASKTDGSKVTGGFTPSLHVRTSKAPCRMNRILWKMGKSTGKQKAENPEFVESGDAALVEFVPQTPMIVDKFENCPGLGRVAVMDSNSLVMMGKIVEVEQRQE